MSFTLCPQCKYKSYGNFPYTIVNDFGSRLTVWLNHCVNCGYEPQVMDLAETNSNLCKLDDFNQRDTRYCPPDEN